MGIISPQIYGSKIRKNKNKTSLGQPPPKKLQHLIQSPLHFRQRSLSWDCHPSCSAIFINCHKRSSTETSVDASQNSWVLCPGCLEHRWFGIGGPLTKDGTHPAPQQKCHTSWWWRVICILVFSSWPLTFSKVHPFLYTSWFYDRIYHGQFQNPHKPWGSVTESDS